MPEPKDTVRGRKKNPKAATQRFLPIGEIRQDTVFLKNGGMRAVIAVEALNFNLKSETEQQGIIAGYGSFVNTLSFPLQIVIRSSRTNVDEYLRQLTVLAEKQTNDLLKQQTTAYVTFIQRLLEVADIMQKRFYVIVPLDRGTRKKTLVEKFFDWIHPEDSSAKAQQRMKDLGPSLRALGERVDLVQAGLTNIGLHVRRLSTRDLLELYYNILNPKTSQQEKIPGDIEPLKLVEATL
ncbi:MAG: hypothetical protein G01um101425_814 [Candidatus Peregrinibacteria bacterium Gr01-1014_25]|nr:MAG: hypothetical protein G01um101425_814 [Candidatus Peregrinibacteria bacterium Gr01-1014_25]